MKDDEAKYEYIDIGYGPLKVERRSFPSIPSFWPKIPVTVSLFLMLIRIFVLTPYLVSWGNNYTGGNAENVFGLLGIYSWAVTVVTTPVCILELLIVAFGKNRNRKIVCVLATMHNMLFPFDGMVLSMLHSSHIHK